MQIINKNYIYKVVKQALNEDLKPLGDITSKLINNSKSKARIVAKQDGVIAGLDFCKSAFNLVGKESVFLKKVQDGSKVKKGKIIATISAKTKTILAAERTGLNFLCHASGIATLTNKFVKKTEKKTKICCTRKTTPNLRLLDKYAVLKGGGFNHRYNLSDEIMIKDNHISATKNIEKILKKALKTKKNITVEIENMSQLNKVLGFKFKRILFDNMSIKMLKKCLIICKDRYETEYSGNVSLKNVGQISKTDVDSISVGSLTHSARSFDFSLELFS